MTLRHSLPSVALATSASFLLLAAFACSPGDEPGGGDGSGASNQGGAPGSGGSLLPPGTGGSTTGTGGLGTAPGPDTCGDGVLNETEACDDGNEESGDGCLGNCLVVEPGFTCSVPGEECRPFAKCGDGLVSPPEQCDGGPDGAFGCSDLCKVQIGFKCTGTPSECDATTCGDNLVEGAEGCDDGNLLPNDGCNLLCQREPSCTAGEGCTSECGDGLRLPFKDGMPFEGCDDGNTDDGDGCSSECEVEEGYECRPAPCEEIDGKCILRVPVVYRDFNLSFPDMKPEGNNDCGATQDLVEEYLDEDDKPVRAVSATNCLSSDANFNLWYRQDSAEAPLNSTIVGELLLFENGAGGYVNRHGANGEKYGTYDGSPLFFPLEGLPVCGAGETLGCVKSDTRYQAAVPPQYGGNWDARSGAYNFHFTTEVTYWFQFDAGSTATFDFTGDDDVWVFVNGRMALDLGGLHEPVNGSFTLSGANAGTYDLVDGNLYEIKVFQAERKVVGSTFRLTLKGFDTSRSICQPDCGDGIVGLGEECDDGDNDGGYNECQAGCVLGGYCGDGIKQDNETCDDNDPDAPENCSGCRSIVIR